MKRRPRLAVEYGVRGDLFGRKGLNGLAQYFRDNPEVFLRDITVLGTGSEQVGDVPTWLARTADKFGVYREFSGWDQFASRFEYIPRLCSDPAAYAAIAKRVKKWKAENEEGEVMFYFSLPYTAYLKTLEAMCANDMRALGHCSWLLFDKPWAITLDGLDQIRSRVELLGVTDSKRRGVDHFCHKHGFDQYMTWAYGNAVMNCALTGQNVARVKFVITETLGTEGRKYDGWMVDTQLNHVNLLIAATLANPMIRGAEYIPRNLQESIDSLSYNPDPNLPEDENRRRQAEFFSRIQIAARYGYCHEDHCKPERVPTAGYISFTPHVNRWPGNTRFEVFHAKNAPEKTMEVWFYLRSGEILRFALDTWQLEQRVWGWQRLGRRLRIDQRGLQAHVESEFYPVPDELADGYPQVVRAFLNGDFSRFMTLGYQREAIRFTMPIAAALDRAGPDAGVWYHKGSLPFGKADLAPDKLVRLT